jgi:hypothetical protein
MKWLLHAKNLLTTSIRPFGLSEINDNKKNSILLIERLRHCKNNVFESLSSASTTEYANENKAPFGSYEIE